MGLETNLEKVLNGLKLVNDFFSNFSCGSVNEDFFREFDDFLTRTMKASPLLVCSMPVDLKELDTIVVNDICQQLHWNRQHLDNTFSKNKLVLLMEYLFKYLRQDTRLAEEGYVIDNQWYYPLIMGEYQSRLYIGIFKVEEEDRLHREIYKALSQQTLRTFANIKTIRELALQSGLIHIDDVTGLFNQRKLHRDLEISIAKYHETGRGFIVLFIDIDHFKNVNDGHGHLVGTRLLMEMGKILKTVLRESDLVYRYGGDEFVMIVPSESIGDVTGIGERILRAIQNKKFYMIDGKEIELTVSIGIARFPGDAETKEDILGMADQMMYHAKAMGRSRVCLAKELIRSD